MEKQQERKSSWLDSLAVRSAMVLALLFGLMFAVGTGVLWYLNQPIWVALLFAFGVVFLQYAIAPWLLDRIFRIEWVSPNHLGPEFDTWLASSCKELKISQPRIGIIHDGNPNAFTYGHTRRDARVVVTSGLLGMLTPEESRGVVAHELEHIAHNDFIVMTVAQSVPLVLYILYTWTRDRARDGGAALAVSIGAYATYIVSQFVVLSLSRVREFFADEGAAKLTKDPNALGTALVKIAYGMAPRHDQVAYEAALEEQKNTKSKTTPTKPRDLGMAGALGICNIQGASGFAITTANSDGKFDPVLMQRAAQWELKNPWAKWYEINSTHPLTARRLNALSRLAKQMGMTPQTPVESDARQYRGNFWFEFFVSALPLGLGAIGYIIGLATLGEGWGAISPALGGYGIGLLIKTLVAYPQLVTSRRQVASLVGVELEASGVNGIPCEVEGEIVGRGVPGICWSKDLVLRDDSGFITLQYQQPFLILELLFGFLKAQRFVGQQVKVRGWYRRAPVPYIEVHSFETVDGSDKVRCYYHYGTIFWGVFFAIVGVTATVMQVNLARTFGEFLLFVWRVLH